MRTRLFNLLFIIFCLMSNVCCLSSSCASETTPLPQPRPLSYYMNRPYKVVRGDTMPGEIFGKQIVYEIKRRDTLLKIALKFDVSYMSIVRANKIKNPALVRSGDKIIIPKRMIFPKKIPKGLLLNLPEYRLYVFSDTEVVKVYPICIGLTIWRTLQGKFKIRNKAINPSWHIPEEMADRLMIPQEIVAPGDTNPLGDRWIGLSLPSTGIHGTIDTMSIGRSSSHGCIRLYPKDIHELFDMVQVGDTGAIIYEPIKIAMAGTRIFLEVHRDIYSLVPKMENEVIKRLEMLGLLSFVDLEKIKEVVKERRGIPLIIGAMLEENIEENTEEIK